MPQKCPCGSTNPLAQTVYPLQGGKIRVPTGQGKLEKVREFEWSGKGQRKIFFLEKSGKMRNMLGFRVQNRCHISAHSCVQEDGSEDTYQIPSSSMTVSFGSSQHGFCS